VATAEPPAEIAGLPTLQALVMWPKLFRRLSSCFGTGFDPLDGFDAWLRADKVNRDDFVLLPNKEAGNMHDLIAIDADLM
jgi:hypothetical protein